jgi:hypothetical protein
MQRTDLPVARYKAVVVAVVLPNLRALELIPLTVLLQYVPRELTFNTTPSDPRLPAKDNLSGEANAPKLLLFGSQLDISAVNSVSVGKRYPLGHGLFIPFTPCHRLLF